MGSLEGVIGRCRGRSVNVRTIQDRDSSNF
nr:MAG TPA: hypothetical protein [Caudoviricetes sp.]